jgi:hypothetical protein
MNWQDGGQCLFRTGAQPLPLQNRVTPFGELVSTPARGLLYGNRGGRIHDPASRRLTGRRWTSRRWICCVTQFKNRHRSVWGPGYTELFFLDEVTALAAGHRPCMECRRRDNLAYRAAVAHALGLATLIMCDDLDWLLHEERLDKRTKRVHAKPVDSLPDGVMVAGPDGSALALRGSAALPWTPFGYGPPVARPSGMVAMLTPPTSVAALKNGFQPRWHDSASLRQESVQESPQRNLTSARPLS